MIVTSKIPNSKMSKKKEMVENPNDTVPLTDDKLLIFFNDDFLLKLFETIELAAYLYIYYIPFGYHASCGSK